MDAIAQVVKDIIDLKIASGNLQEDGTIENMMEWYEWGLYSGHVQVEYKYGELQGFISWVRLNEIPKNRQGEDSAVSNVDWDNQTGPVLYIGNCCVLDDGKRHGVMWKLIYKVREKNQNCKYFCWHEGSDEAIKVWKNNKTQARSEVKEGVAV